MPTDLHKTLQLIKTKTDPFLNLNIKDEKINISATLQENFEFLLDYKEKIIQSIPAYRNKSYDYWSKIANISTELKSRRKNLLKQQNELTLIQSRQYKISKTKTACAEKLRVQENELLKLHNEFIKNDKKIEYCENRVANSSKVKNEKVSNFINAVFQNNNRNKMTKLAEKLAYRKTHSIDLAQLIDTKQNKITDASTALANSKICLTDLQQTNILLRQDIQTILSAISDNAKEILDIEKNITKNTANLKTISSSLVDIIEQETRVECTCQNEQNRILTNLKPVPLDWLQENDTVINKSGWLKG
jgi:chromosome segregation ATPase